MQSSTNNGTWSDALAQLREWALKRTEFSGLLDGFAKKAQVGDIEVWARVGAR